MNINQKVLKDFNTNSPTYVIDFLNVFSDFREIKYKMCNIDFHLVKHINKISDTEDFFKFFFTRYILHTGINKNGTFLFIMKKISNYDKILYGILELYKAYNIRFIIIENKYKLDILDKNKDDFLCQYIISYLMCNNDNCILISNDKYRDKNVYVKEFSNIKNNFTCIRIITNKNKILIEDSITYINIEQIICDKILTQVYKRCTIPKNKLKNILC
jgi:hypothetical protein